MNWQGTLPFASLVLETPALKMVNWYKYLEDFLQDGGGFVLLGLWIWLIATVMRAIAPQGKNTARVSVPLLLLVVAVLSLAAYAMGFAGSYMAAAAEQAKPGSTYDPLDPDFGRGKWWYHCFTLGGALAILGIVVPFARDLLKVRPRRIWALTRLAFLEAIRRRILLVFLAFLLLFLFPAKWWDPNIKPEDEIRSHISLIYTGTTPLLLLAAGLLTSFSLPTDIRNQTIHTVVTKPVERFEIIVGRFLGYLGLTGMVLFLVTGLSLLMISVTRIDQEAKEESKKARVPLYGQLRFLGPAGFKGESVGREWDYRKYVPGGGPRTPYRAVWDFRDADLDSDLPKLPWIPCEFSFDIFRTTKAEENKGVFCTFFVATHQAFRDPDMPAKYQERIKGISPNAKPVGTKVEEEDWNKLSKIAEELGYFEYRNKLVEDYHTQSIPLPAGLFAKAFQGNPENVDVPGKGQEPVPRLVISVRCDSPTQFIGVAYNDLYLLAEEGNFYANYFKGALGLFMRLALVIGIAVTLSTYLNGVVTLLATNWLIVLGFLRTAVIALVFVPLGGDTRNNPGPTDSLRRLVTNESLGIAPDPNSATQQVTIAFDAGFRWNVRRLLNVIPNMERLTWEQYVAKGFNIPRDDLGLNFLGVLGYLSLWIIFGHYLIKWREIATW